MATEVLISVTTSPTLSKSGLSDLRMTLYATSSTSQTISADPSSTILDPQMYVFGYEGFTFTDAVSKECIARPQINLCYMYSGITDPKKTPAYGAQQPYIVTPEMKFWTPDIVRRRTEMAEKKESLFAERASAAPNGSADIARSADHSGWHSLNPTAAFEIGHTYEIGLGDHWNQIRRWNTYNPQGWLDWWYAPASIDDRTAGPLRLIFVNKATFEVTE